MDEKQLQLLWDLHAKNGGFSSYEEFKSLMSNGNARKTYFESANKELGFKDYNEFDGLLKKKDGITTSSPTKLPLQKGDTIPSFTAEEIGIEEEKPLPNPPSILTEYPSGAPSIATSGGVTKVNDNRIATRKKRTPLQHDREVVMPTIREIAKQQQSLVDNPLQKTEVPNFEQAKDPEKYFKQKAKEREEVTVKAIDNTVARLLKQRGINPDPNSPEFAIERARYRNKVNKGEAIVGLDKENNFAPGLRRTIGWWEGISKGWNEAVQGEEDADNFVNNMTTEERIEFVNQQPKPDEYIGEWENTGGSIGKFGAGAAPFLIKAGAGAAVGASTGMVGAPIVGSILFTQGDAINHGAMSEMIRSYHAVKEMHPDISDEDAMKIAEQGAMRGMIGGGVTNIALMRAPQLSSTSKDLIKKYVFHPIKVSGYMGGISAGVEVGKNIVGNAQGVKTDIKDIAKNAMTAFEDNFNAMLGLQVLTHHVPAAIKNVPYMVRNAIKYGLAKDVKPEFIEQTLRFNEENGVIPEGTTNEVIKDISEYKQALDKVTPGLSPEAEASVAGLILKRTNLEKEKKTKDETAYLFYDKQIESINNQIADIHRTNKPLEHEIDEITGETYEKPTFDNVAEKTVNDLAEKISKGKSIEDAIDIKAEQQFPEQLEKALNRILREEKSKNKDKENPNTDISDNIEKYLEDKKPKDVAPIVEPEAPKVEGEKEDISKPIELGVEPKVTVEQVGEKLKNEIDNNPEAITKLMELSDEYFDAEKPELGNEADRNIIFQQTAKEYIQAIESGDNPKLVEAVDKILSNENKATEVPKVEREVPWKDLVIENIFGETIESKVFNYDHPIAEKIVNGIKYRIAEGKIKDKKKTYLLYKEKEVIGEFNSVDEAKKAVSEVVPEAEVIENSKKDVNSQNNGKGEAQNISPEEVGGTKNSPQQPTQTGKEKTLTQKVQELEDVIDPYDRVLQHFANDGKISQSAIEQFFGSKGRKSTENERRAKISIIGKNAKSIDQLAHELWESDQTGKFTTEDYKNAIESVLSDHNSKASMQKELVEKYDYESAAQKYFDQLGTPEDINKRAVEIVDKMSEDEINNLIQLSKENSESVDGYVNSLNEKSKPSTKEPPKPPIEPPKPPEGEGKPKELRDKSLLNRLVESKNIPEVAREGYKKNLKYEPQSHQEAEAIGKEIINEMGIEDAVLMAEATRFGGGVNSAIFAESLNRLYEMEQQAKTPAEKKQVASQFAEIGMRYDEWLRQSGRDISQVAHFYKKSPLGIKLMEEAKNKERFQEWSKNKEQSWKDVFEEMMKEPEFEKQFKERVEEELKKERTAARATRKKKIDDFFDKAKGEFDGGATYATIIPPPIIKAAIEGMRLAVHAGTKVVDVVTDAISYISKELGNDKWDSEKFRKEWEDKLNKIDAKASKKTPAELSFEKQEKILDRFRKKLKGLSEAEKAEVIRKSFKQLVENGALKYDDFKKIIADVMGYGEMTPEQSAKLTELVETMNVVDEIGRKAREEKRTPEALKEYLDAKKKAEKAAKELSSMLYTKPKIISRLLTLMQLNTLGVPSLVNNPIFNIVNQAAVRFPIGLQLTLLDKALHTINKSWEPQTNVFASQGQFFSKLGRGTRESFEQLFNGLTSMDYMQKEIQASQIRPFKAAKELWEWKKGERKLTKEQAIDRFIQASPFGISAEAVARVLNIGDKPQRFAAEGAKAAVFAKNLGLKGMDFQYFMEFPKEEAYAQYKKKGLSDEAAMKKAQEVYDGIIKQGQESTFQQDNIVNDALNYLFEQKLGTPGKVVKMFNLPFLKIPLNAFWSAYNLINPEVAFLQSAYYGSKAIKAKLQGKEVSIRDIEESKRWLAHGTTGMAILATTTAMATAGIFNAGNDDGTTKKERQAERQYEQQKSFNVNKFWAWVTGKDPSKVKGGLNIDSKWLGVIGAVGNIQAKKWEEMTPEQREAGLGFMEDMYQNLTGSTLDLVENGVFSNVSGMKEAFMKGGPALDNYLLNLMNMAGNIVQPATFAQWSRASLPYHTTVKADNFWGEVKNSLLARSSVVRTLAGKYPPSAIGIWGDELKKGNSTMLNLFGMSEANKDNFAQVLYEDYKKSGDLRFFPSAVKPEIEMEGQTVKLNTAQARDWEMLVGQRRKSLITPFVNDMAKISVIETGEKYPKDVYKKYSEIKDTPEGKEEKIRYLKIVYDMGLEQAKDLFFLKYPKLMPPERDTDMQKLKSEVNKSNKEDLPEK